MSQRKQGKRRARAGPPVGVEPVPAVAGEGSGAGEPSTVVLALVLGLLFTSGAAGLVYEILWMKELTLLFGSDARAASATLAAFFLGIAAGGAYWGRRAARLANPLRTYAALELGVAVTALLHFAVRHGYRAVYPSLFELFGGGSAPFVAVKFALSCGLLFPPAFFMGGTLPVIGEALVRRRTSLGALGSLIYAANTIGAALGALAAGFWLPAWLGFTRSYVATVAATTAVAVAAWLLSRAGAFAARVERWSPAAVRPDAAPPASPSALRGLAFLSGFAALALEVLWVHMFAQVLQNSVYTFAAILVTFLVSLALGAVLAHRLIRSRLGFERALLLLLVSAGLLVAGTPFVFDRVTDGLSYLGADEAWGGYVAAVFRATALVLLPPGIVVGAIFPLLLKGCEPHARTAGRELGDLTATNTLGAVVGSTAAGFGLIAWFGLWPSVRLIGGAYLVVALLLAVRLLPQRVGWRLAPAGGLLLLLSLLDVTGLPVVWYDPIGRGESLLATYEGGAGTVAVVRRGDHLRIKTNNWYRLGGTEARKAEEMQGHLALLTNAGGRSVFFLGLGSGITAGAAARHPVSEIVVAELVPDVVRAAREYFGPYCNGLFDDERVLVVAEDGRNHLFGTRRSYDVIVADLFIPWRSGVGGLYSVEHFAAALERLSSSGTFAQWLPLYQMSGEEFGIVARTMIEVFPLVTLWRGDFTLDEPAMMLVGHSDPSPIERGPVEQRLRALEAASTASEDGGGAAPLLPNLEGLLVHYCGNLTRARSLFDDDPLELDDRPIIEYRAPISHREEKAKQRSWLVGDELVGLLEDILRAAPLDEDPYLEGLPAEVRQHALIGLALHGR